MSERELKQRAAQIFLNAAEYIRKYAGKLAA
jgi:hypothetical protein